MRLEIINSQTAAVGTEPAIRSTAVYCLTTAPTVPSKYIKNTYTISLHIWQVSDTGRRL